MKLRDITRQQFKSQYVVTYHNGNDVRRLMTLESNEKLQGSDVLRFMARDENAMKSYQYHAENCKGEQHIEVTRTETIFSVGADIVEKHIPELHYQDKKYVYDIEISDALNKHKRGIRVFTDNFGLTLGIFKLVTEKDMNILKAMKYDDTVDVSCRVWLEENVLSHFCLYGSDAIEYINNNKL
jgi:hypothetical protein